MKRAGKQLGNANSEKTASTSKQAPTWDSGRQSWMLLILIGGGQELRVTLHTERKIIDPLQTQFLT